MKKIICVMLVLSIFMATPVFAAETVGESVVCDTTVITTVGGEYLLPSVYIDTYSYFVVQSVYAYFFDTFALTVTSSAAMLKLTDYVYINLDLMADDCCVSPNIVTDGSKSLSLRKSPTATNVAISADILDDTGTVVVATNIASITRPVTSYTISFDTGYDDIFIDSLTTDTDGLLADLPVPASAPDGYAFDGWYLDYDYQTSVDSSYVYTESVTLYAKWLQVGSGIDYTPMIRQLAQQQAATNLLLGALFVYLFIHNAIKKGW